MRGLEIRGRGGCGRMRGVQMLKRKNSKTKAGGPERGATLRSLRFAIPPQRILPQHPARPHSPAKQALTLSLRGARLHQNAPYIFAPTLSRWSASALARSSASSMIFTEIKGKEGRRYDGQSRAGRRVKDRGRGGAGRRAG